MREIKKRESFLEKYEKIVNLSISENEYIRSKYNWHLKIASGIIILTIVCAAWLISDNLSGYQEILDNKFADIISATEGKQDSLNNLFVESTNKNIKDLVAKNFNQREILNTIEVVATEKVDSFSNQYLDRLVEKKITPKLNSVLSNLEIADTKIQFMEFYLYKVAVYNDDRISFEKLLDISHNKNNEYSTEAGQIVQSIINMYSKSAVPPKHFILRSTEKDEDFSWSYDDCRGRIFDYPKDERIVILENVIEIKRFTENEKIEFALLVIKKDESLLVIRKASNFLINKFNLPLKSLEIKKIISSMADRGYN